MAPTTSLEELLVRTEHSIIEIKSRLAPLVEFETAMAALPKSKLAIRNDIVMQLLRDSYSMMIIEFASLSRGMLAAGGFFNSLKNYCANLRRISYRKITAPRGVF